MQTKGKLVASAIPSTQGWELRLEGYPPLRVPDLDDAPDALRSFLSTQTGEDFSGVEVEVRTIFPF